MAVFSPVPPPANTRRGTFLQRNPFSITRITIFMCKHLPTRANSCALSPIAICGAMCEGQKSGEASSGRKQRGGRAETDARREKARKPCRGGLRERGREDARASAGLKGGNADEIWRGGGYKELVGPGSLKPSPKKPPLWGPARSPNPVDATPPPTACQKDH